MSNEHLKQLGEGATSIVVQLPFGSYTDGGGVDYLPPGNYAARIDSITLKPQKSGAGGVVAHIEHTVTQPAKYAGLKIKNFPMMPVGDLSEEATARNALQIMRLWNSALTFLGKEETRPEDNAEIELMALIGAEVGLYVQDSDPNGKGYINSNVKWSLNKADFEKAPGPLDPNHPGTPPRLSSTSDDLASAGLNPGGVVNNSLANANAPVLGGTAPMSVATKATPAAAVTPEATVTPITQEAAPPGVSSVLGL